MSGKKERKIIEISRRDLEKIVRSHLLRGARYKLRSEITHQLHLNWSEQFDKIVLPKPVSPLMKLFHLLEAEVGRGSRVRRPPGARLDAFAAFVFSKRTYATVFKADLAETQAEYFEALSEGKTRKAQWVRIRGVAGFWWTGALQMPVSLTRLLKKLWTVSGV